MKKYILGMVLTMLLGLGGIFNADTMALDSDYKNNLLKVDVVKAGEDNYKIDLFTQKPYNEPIKVIKKSDTSYYVLLPETYHSITSVQPSGDVNKVDVKLYPYAGQDLNNGYTKINISTTKPVTFSANVKTATAKKPQVDAKRLAQLDKAFENKGVNLPVKVETAKTVQQQPKAETAPAKAPAKPASTANKPKEPVRVASNSQNNVNLRPKAGRTAENAGSSGEIEIVTKPKVNEPVKQQEIVIPKDANAPALEEVMEAEETAEELQIEEDAKNQGLRELATGEQEPIPEMTMKQRVKQALISAAKVAYDNVLLVIVIILLLIVLVLLSQGKKAPKAANTVLEGVSDWKQPEGETSLASNVMNNKEDEPAGSEFGAYESSVEPAGVETYEPKPMQTYEEAAAAVGTMQEVEEESEDEAEVLANESFGENRGLCLVNYDGSIALIGYIGEEIFVIQNFGKITLINPNIQIRIAEQNDNDTIYIVKTANSKLMVRETKDLIGLEMVM